MNNKNISFGQANPLIIPFWSKNNSISPFNAPRTSKKEYEFICENGHSSHKKLHYFNKLKRKIFICQKCKPNNKLHILKPELFNYYDHNKNTVPLNNITTGMNIDIHLKCKNGHQFSRKPKHINESNSISCTYCSGKQSDYNNRFDLTNPFLVREWDFHKNSTNPNFFAFNSNEKVWWKCKHNHSWEATISQRTGTRYKNKKNPSNCPYCYSPSKSRNELIIFSEIHQFFNNVYSTYKLKKRELDIYIEDINLGIEYDGEFYHRNKHLKDALKNAFFIDNNIKVIRIRELGLDKINSNDLIYDPSDDLFNSIVLILNYIVNNFCINKKTILKIRNYIKKGKITNSDLFNSIKDQYKIKPIKEPKKLLCYSTKNTLPIHYYGNGSMFKALWKCPSCNYEWKQSINKFVRKKCSNCKCVL
jgi:rubrerythrin